MKSINAFGIATLLLTSMLTIMVGSAIAPSLIEINAQLNFQFDSGLLITLPSLGVVIFSPFVGRLINKIGSFKLLCLGLIPYAVFGYGGGFLTNSYLLIIDRVLLGGAAVAVQIAATAIIAENFLGKERMKIIAWQGMAIEGGGVLFLSIGGILGEINWQFPFLIYLIALVCLVLSFVLLPKSAPEQDEQLHTTSNTHPHIRKLVWITFAAALFAMVVFFTSFIHLPQYLPEEFGFTESKTGYLMSFISLIAVIIASQMPRIAQAITSGYTSAMGFVFFGLGYVLFAWAGSVTMLYVAATIIGIGFGLTIPTLNHLMVEVSSPQTRGKNLGLYSMGVFGGQFLSTFLGFLIHDIPTLFVFTAVLSWVIALTLGLLFRKYQNPIAAAHEQPQSTT